MAPKRDAPKKGVAVVVKKSAPEEEPEEEPPKKGVAKVVKPAPKKVPKKAQEVRNDYTGLKADRNKWTCEQLKQLCAFHDITAKSKAKKAELVALVEGLDAPGADEPGDDPPAKSKKAPAPKKKTTKTPAAPKAVETDEPKKKKKTPKGGFRAGGVSKSPSPEPPVDKTASGRVTKPAKKATGAEKARASKYRDRLAEIMKKMRDDSGKTEVREGVFGDVYEDLVQAGEELHAVETAEAAEEPVVAEPEAHLEPEDEEHELPESGDEGSLPPPSDGAVSDGDYVSEGEE